MTKLDTLRGHFVVVGERSRRSEGQERFYVRQEPVLLDPTEEPIVRRYVKQALRAVAGSKGISDINIVDENVVDVIDEFIQDEGRETSLKMLAERLCKEMNASRGTPGPGILFGLKVVLGSGVTTTGAIKADLTRDEMAQLRTGEGEGGRLRLEGAEDILERPQQRFAKVLFSPKPDETKIPYVLSDTKASGTPAAAYFLKCLGVQTPRRSGTLSTVVKKVIRDSAPEDRHTRADEVFDTVDRIGKEAEKSEVPLSSLRQEFAESDDLEGYANTLDAFQKDEVRPVVAVDRTDQVKKTWKLAEPFFYCQADRNIEVDGPRLEGDEYVLAFRLPAFPDQNIK